MMDKNFFHGRKRGPKTHDRSHHSGRGQNPGEDPRTLRKHALHGALRELAIRAGTIEKTVDDLLDMRPPEPEFRGESFVEDKDEFLEIILDTAIPTRGLWITRTINCWSVVHGSENIGEQKVNGKRKCFFGWMDMLAMDNLFLRENR